MRDVAGMIRSFGYATGSAVAAGADEETMAAWEKAAVDAFLTGRLRWTDIVEVDAAVVGEHEGAGTGDPALEDVLAVEAWARRRADELIAGRSL